MDVSLIVAKSANDVIGYQNQLPWRIPEDLKLFKKHTLNKAVIMGRKTYESIGKALPNRLNIVLTRNGFRADDVHICHSLADAIQRGSDYSAANGHSEIMIIGGAEIFEEALPLATRIYLTNIPRHFVGDAFFPTSLIGDWHVVHQERQTTISDDVSHFFFSILSRVFRPQFQPAE